MNDPEPRDETIIIVIVWIAMALSILLLIWALLHLGKPVHGGYA